MLLLLNKLIEYAFYALFFFTPVIFNPNRDFPSSELFEWNKMIFVYVITTFVVGIWICKMILRRKIVFHRTPFDLPLLLFLLSQILSTLFSIDRHVSIFGYYSRFHGGLLSTISYTLLFFAFTANKKTINIRRLIIFMLASGLIVASFGVAQHFGIDVHIWVQDVRARVFSTLGQPNWLAAYIVFLLLIAIAHLIFELPSSYKPASKQTPSFLNRGTATDDVEPIFLNSGKIVIYLLLIFIFYICLLYTKSRSGFLGFWISAGVFWSVLFWIKRRDFRLLFPVFLILNLLLLFLNFLIRTPIPQYNKFLTVDIFYKQKVVEEMKIPAGETIISVGITDSANIRQIVWKGAVEIIQAYPLFGTGPETFAYAYYRFRPVEHNQTSEWDFLYNRAHNELLNITATSGLTGLVTYLFFTVVVMIYGIKRIFTITDNQKNILILALIAVFVSIQITNFFGFSVVIIGIFFFMTPALLIKLDPLSETEFYDETKLTESISPSTPQLVVISMVVFAVIITFISIFRLWYSDSLYAKSLAATRQSSYVQSYELIKKAIEVRSDEPNFYDEKANIASNLADAFFQEKDATHAADLAQDAISSSTIALKISPQNVIYWKTRTRLLFMLSSYAPEFTEEALRSILVAAQLAPTDPRISYNVAVLYGRLNKNRDAINELQKTIELKPDYRDAYLALSIYYEDEKQPDKARTALEFVLKHINPDDKEAKEKLEKLK